MTIRQRCLLFTALLAGCDAPTSPLPTAHELSLGESPTLWVSTLRGGAVHAWSADGLDLGPVVSEANLPEVHRTRPFEPSSARLVEDELWVSNFATGQVFAFEPDTGLFLRSVFENDGPVRIEEPAVIQPDHGRTWVLGNDTRNLVGLSDEAEAEELDTDWTFRHAHGLALRDDGLAWVGTSPVTQELGLVQARDLDTGELVDDFAPWGELEEATGLAFERGGTLLVVDFFQQTLTRWDPDTGRLLDVLADHDRGLERPIAVEVQSDGTIWVLDVQGLVRVGQTVERRVWFDQPDVSLARGLTLIE